MLDHQATTLLFCQNPVYQFSDLFRLHQRLFCLRPSLNRQYRVFRRKPILYQPNLQKDIHGYLKLCALGSQDSTIFGQDGELISLSSRRIRIAKAKITVFENHSQKVAFSTLRAERALKWRKLSVFFFTQLGEFWYDSAVEWVNFGNSKQKRHENSNTSSFTACKNETFWVIFKHGEKGSFIHQYSQRVSCHLQWTSIEWNVISRTLDYTLQELRYILRYA